MGEENDIRQIRSARVFLRTIFLLIVGFEFHHLSTIRTAIVVMSLIIILLITPKEQISLIIIAIIQQRVLNILSLTIPH